MHMIWLWLLGCAGTVEEPVDGDRDGVVAALDCDDADPFAYPGANERCNGKDDNCDGVVDSPDASGTQLWFLDGDGDGFGEIGSGVRACEVIEGRVGAGGDCDDNRIDVHPGALDDCDGHDNDCDGHIDEEGGQRGFVDLDLDGFAGTDEKLGCIGVDVYAAALDCDDSNADVAPGQEELCNGIDDDCDGGIDDADVEGASGKSLWFADVDVDGFGVDDQTIEACDPPSGNVASIGGDCDDLDAQTHPGAFEGCEPVDRDCDGAFPDGAAWWDAAWPVRVPVTVEHATDLEAPVLSFSVDAAAALGGAAFDDRAIALIVQDCAGGGAVRLDAQFTDSTGALFAGDPTDPLGDGVGGVHAVLDRDLVGGEPLTLALYLGGSISSVPGEAEAIGNNLSTGALDTSFDPLRGGLLDDVGPLGTVWASAADAAQGNGAMDLTGWLPKGIGTVDVLEPGGMLASVLTQTPEVRDGLEILTGTQWFAISGRSDIYGRTTSTVQAGGGIAGQRSLQWTAGINEASAVAITGNGWAALDAGSASAGAGWMDGPIDATADCANGECWLAGASASLPGVLATGTLLVEPAWLMLRVAEGPWADQEDGFVSALQTPTVTVGDAETP